MRTVNNGIKVYELAELGNDARFNVYEKFLGREVVCLAEDEIERIQKYYTGVEFYEDGTVYEEV